MLFQKPFEKNPTLPGSITELWDKLVWGNQKVVTEKCDFGFERGARGAQAFSTVDLVQISVFLLCTSIYTPLRLSSRP